MQTRMFHYNPLKKTLWNIKLDIWWEFKIFFGGNQNGSLSPTNKPKLHKQTN